MPAIRASSRRSSETHATSPSAAFARRPAPPQLGTSGAPSSIDASSKITHHSVFGQVVHDALAVVGALVVLVQEPAPCAST